MEKLKPHFRLEAIKTTFSDPARLNRIWVSRLGADDLALDDIAVVNVIQSLQQVDFEKSMTSNSDHRIWQDVYRPVVGGRALYVKFTLDGQGEFLLISFMEA